MAIYGTVVDVQIGVKIQGQSKTYEGYRLTYRDKETGKIQEWAKPMQGLKFQPSLRTSLEELKPGDDFVLVTKKNEAGFLEAVSLTKGSEAQELPPDVPTTVTGTTRPTGKVLGSTYETPEERKIKQRLIVRQSSFAQALEWHRAADAGLGLDEVLDTADEIETWVYRGL